MASDFWKKKKVLVTGAYGFMGSHLAETLLEKGADVSIFVRDDSSSAIKKSFLVGLAGMEPKFKEVIKGDLSNAESRGLIKKNEPEIIFHLAAEAYVNYSFDHPIEVMESNLVGTLNVLEAARESENIKQIVCTSSSEIYGPAMTEGIDETHPLNPTSPYAASKAAADRYCYAYWNTYGMPIATIRPFNTYGPRHTYDVIPKFIALALRNEPLTVYGTGEQTRDFTYVSDMVEAFLLMGSRKEAIGKAINFGNGKDYSINGIAEKIIRLANSKSKIAHIEGRKSEVRRLICNYGLAKKLLGWEPKISIDEGLKRNIEWTKRNIENIKM